MAAQDLTSLGAVRSFLQKATSDIGQDPIIGSFITRASDAIMHYTDREFAPVSTAATRTFEYRGGGWLSIAPYDLQNATRLRIDVDESSPTTLTTFEYRPYPSHKPNGVYTAIRLAPYLVHSRSRWNQRLVEVTGDWGFPSVPTDVEHACIHAVAIWLRRDVTAYESVLTTDEPHLERPTGLPGSVMAMLTPYKRQSV